MIARPRRRVFLSLLLVSAQVLALSVVAVVLLVAGWVQSPDFERRAIHLVEGIVEERSGEELTITALNLTLWPLGADFQGVHLFDGASGETLISADRVRVPIRFSPGRYGLGRIVLERPVVLLEIGEDGKLMAFEDAPRPENPKPLTRLPFESLEIQEGRVRVSFPDGSVAIQKLRLTEQDNGTHVLRRRVLAPSA